MPVQIQIRHDTAANWTSVDPTLAEGEMGVETDTGMFKFGDGATAWSGLTYSGAGTALNPLVMPDISTPGSPPGSGLAFLYSKSDGRIYSMDEGGIEYGPFDTGGGGGGFEYDITFPGSSLPSGFAFTGSGSVTVSGSKAAVTCAGQGDRLMYAYTPTNANQLTMVRAHLKNITNYGGMPSLCGLDSSGKGYGTGPYNDGNFYNWWVQGTAYHYSNTGNSLGANPSTADIWLGLSLMGNKLVGTGYSLDGIAWTTQPINTNTAVVVTQLGMVQLFVSANPTFDFWELTTTAA